MKPVVYMIDLKATVKENLLDKFGRLVKTAGLNQVIDRRDLAAVKLHFGELGNTAFIRPLFLRKIVERLKALGAVPFLTDANTLYVGTRSDAPSHLKTAISNGFAFAVVDAPLIIADGLRGRSETVVRINRKRFQTVYIASEIVQADALISVAHFKGHELSGFGGTLKNLGMGCASRRGKMAQHSTVSPKVVQEKCIGCGECVQHCSQEALSLFEENALIDAEKCIGCGECILVCPRSAIQIEWNQAIPIFLENMMEYTEGVLKGKENKSLFINFLTDVSPACDCYSYNDAPIVRNIGILASRDPVAIDQASVDRVNQEAALPEADVPANRGAGEDKFRGIYPHVDWAHQLDYAEKLGLGSRTYTLKKI